MGTKRSGGSAGGGGGGSIGSSQQGDSAQTTFGSDTDEEPDAVEEYCEEKAEETSVPEDQGKEVAERRDRIREALEERFEITDEHIIGSFTRDTLVGPLGPDSDTDVMFVLDEEKHGHWIDSENGEKNCLQQIKRAIEDDPKYRNTEVSIDRNVVAVQFNDFTVEVVPAFEQSEGYVIPDTYQEGNAWNRTNPRRYKQMFEATNDARDGKLSKLTRLTKQYNKRQGETVSPYHMELMTYEYMSEQGGSQSLDEHLGDFFQQLPSRLSSGTYNPSTEQRIDHGMSNENRQEAIENAKKARKKARRAKRLKQSGNEEKAQELYEELLNGEIEG